jgi:hypothetical protein
MIWQKFRALYAQYEDLIACTFVVVVDVNKLPQDRFSNGVYPAVRITEKVSCNANRSLFSEEILRHINLFSVRSSKLDSCL